MHTTNNCLQKTKQYFRSIVRLTNNGFSMVEMMIAVVVASVCLVMVLRVYSVCAIAVSDTYNSKYAVEILQEKMDLLQEDSIMNDGIETGTLAEDIKKGGRKFRFRQDIVEWVKPPEETEEDENEEDEDAATETGLAEVRMEVTWGRMATPKNLIVKTILPIKGFGHEF